MSEDDPAAPGSPAFISRAGVRHELPHMVCAVLGTEPRFLRLLVELPIN